MHSNETLFETIMRLNHTEIPHQSPSNKLRANRNKPKKQRKPITIETRYSHLVAEGSRLDITIERRIQIREELTLIRQQKRMMMKTEYHM